MCVHINTMPDDDLLLIFDRIPLSNLLQLDRVCHRWACLLPSACARRRTLVLILGGTRVDETNFEIAFNNNFKISFDGRYPYYNLPLSERESCFMLPCLLPKTTSFEAFLWNDHDDDESQGFFDIIYYTSIGDTEADFCEMSRFHNAHLAGLLVAYLTDLFSNVENLVIIHTKCYEQELSLVIDLLGSSWSLSTVKLWLRTLNMDLRYADHLEHHPVRSLLHGINQKATLQQLTLDIDGDAGLEHNFPMESYFFIAKLKVAKLYFGTYDGDDLICDIMHRFHSAQLRYIGLGNYFDASVEAVLSPKLEFNTKVRQLYWHLSFDSAEQFSQFCWRYSSLTMLEMDWTPQITFTQLVTNLSSLAQLTHLKLDMDFEEHPENAFVLAEQVEGDEEGPSRNWLPQVKILELVINKRSHHDFESLSPAVFASVEVIIYWDYFISSGCNTCRRTINGHENDRQRANRCYRLMILSLKNKMTKPLLRLYAKRVDSGRHVDWSNYVQTEDDDLRSIGDGDEVEQPDEVEA